MDRSEHAVAVRVQLAAVGLDQAAEGLLVAAARRLEQFAFLCAAGDGSTHLPQSSASSIPAAPPGRADDSAFWGRFLACPLHFVPSDPDVTTTHDAQLRPSLSRQRKGTRNGLPEHVAIGAKGPVRKAANDGTQRKDSFNGLPQHLSRTIDLGDRRPDVGATPRHGSTNWSGTPITSGVPWKRSTPLVPGPAGPCSPRCRWRLSLPSRCPWS